MVYATTDEEGFSTHDLYTNPRDVEGESCIVGYCVQDFDAGFCMPDGDDFCTSLEEAEADLKQLSETMEEDDAT